MAAAPFAEAMNMNEDLRGEVVVIKDLLNVGPLKKQEDGQKFSELRTAFWQEVVPGEKSEISVDDMERMLKVSAAMAADEQIQAWVWLAPWPADTCTLLWLTKYLGKYPGRFYVVNVAGLPFLDDNGKVFYPKNISELNAREVVKARRLARPVSYAEIETDAEEWQKLVTEDAPIRTLDGGKRITSRKADYYDAHLFASCTAQFQKASRVVNQAMTKNNIPTGDLYLGWRLRQMAAGDKIRMQGDPNKTLKDFDVKLPEATLNL